MAVAVRPDAGPALAQAHQPTTAITDPAAVAIRPRRDRKEARRGAVLGRDRVMTILSLMRERIEPARGKALQPACWRRRVAPEAGEVRSESMTDDALVDAVSAFAADDLEEARLFCRSASAPGDDLAQAMATYLERVAAAGATGRDASPEGLNDF